MTQKDWYEKLLNWVETDTRLDDMHQMQLVVLAEHLANEESGLTQRAPDEGYCAHDWSFPPKFCPVCNKRVPLIRLRG